MKIIPKIPGIYRIVNTINKKIYIGSAINLYNRNADHLCRLRGNYHHSKHLQRAYNKYGEKVFRFEVLANCPKEYLIKLEQWFIDNLKPEYNTCKIAGSTLDVKPSIRSRKKMSLSRTGKKRSICAIEKTRKANKIPIIQLSLTGDFIAEWDSSTDASNTLKINKAHITSMCRGRSRPLSIGGFKWKYK